MYPRSFTTVTESSEFHTHTNRHYTLLCVLLFRLSETKNIQNSEQISFFVILSSK